MIDFDSIPTSDASSHLKFTFDAGTTNSFLNEKITRRNSLSGRLDKLVNEPTIGGYPFIRYVFQHVSTIDPEELRQTARALDRIADLWEPYQRIDKEVKGLCFAKDNSSLVALAFGEFNVPENPDAFLALINNTTPGKDAK